MRFLRAIVGHIGAPFRSQQRRLLLAAVLLVTSVAMLTTGLAGLLLAKESEPAVVNRGTLELPRNGLDTPTATPVPTPPPSSAPVVRMIIEKIGVDAPVMTLGLDENGLPQAFDSPYDVAWYDFSSKPGWGGNAVFSAHFDQSVQGMPVIGVFYSLADLKAGDIVQVKLTDGTDFRYGVMDNLIFPDGDPQVLELMAATPADMATLVTCGALWTLPTPSPGDRFWARRVVRAQLIQEPSTDKEHLREPLHEGIQG